MRQNKYFAKVIQKENKQYVDIMMMNPKRNYAKLQGKEWTKS